MVPAVYYVPLTSPYSFPLFLFYHLKSIHSDLCPRYVWWLPGSVDGRGGVGHGERGDIIERRRLPTGLVLGGQDAGHRPAHRAHHVVPLGTRHRRKHQHRHKGRGEGEGRGGRSKQHKHQHRRNEGPHDGGGGDRVAPLRPNQHKHKQRRGSEGVPLARSVQVHAQAALLHQSQLTCERGGVRGACPYYIAFTAEKGFTRQEGGSERRSFDCHSEGWGEGAGVICLLDDAGPEGR